LVFGEEAYCGQDRDEQKAEDELGEFLPEEGGFVGDGLGLASAGPIDGVGEDDKADEGVARGFSRGRLVWRRSRRRGAPAAVASAGVVHGEAARRRRA